MITENKEDKNYYNEMARVGSFDSKGNSVDFGEYEVRIYPEESGNPSFHLLYKNEWEYVLEIETFKVLEMKINKLKLKKVEYLSKNILKILIKFLSEIEGNTSNWEFLLKTWNSNNPKYKVNIDLELPK